MDLMPVAHVVKRLLAPVLGIAALAAAAPAHAFVTLAPAYTDSASAPVVAPIYVTGPPADSSRLFVVERAGRIRVAVNGVMKDAPFLDIRSRVQTTGEAGLLSMAFAPDYAISRKFYVYFVQESDGHIRVEQYTRSVADLDLADTTPTAMLDVAHPGQTNHYGGQLAFGPDGLLYAGTGDGGGANDPNGNAQNPASRLGKLLAIDTSTATVTTSAIGLRNPFRFSFDHLTGDIAIGDVGQSAWEEVDYVPAAPPLSGLNFGWPCFEGPDPHGSCPPITHAAPVFAYPDPASGAVAITGGVVVRDPALTTLFGRYLYADVYAGRVRSLLLATPSASDDRLETDIPKVSTLVAFGEDAEQHVYVVSLDGAVSRIVCEGACSEPRPKPPVPEADPPPPPIPGPEQPPGLEPSPNPAATLPPATRDSVPPALNVRAARVQNIVRRGTVRLSVAAGESAIVRITARARGLALNGALVRLAPGRRVVVELRASTRLRRLLAKRGVVAIQLRARDGAGNLRVAALTVAVKRR
jgi:hypothetical protein